LYGGRQLYSGIIQQGLLVINENNQAAGGASQVFIVSDVGPGTAAKVFL